MMPRVGFALSGVVVGSVFGLPFGVGGVVGGAFLGAILADVYWCRRFPEDCPGES